MKPLGFLLVVHLTSFTVAAQHSNSQGIAVKKDERVVVDCSLKADMGIYWFRQTESETPTFLFYINGVGKVTPEITGYSATKTSSKVSLTVNSFTKEDSGKYYCVTLKNMAMVFGQVKILYLKEVKSTTQPTTSKAKSTAPKNKETIPCSSTTTVLGIQEDKMSCHIFIWAPLTGAAFLLLLALIFVSIVYCRRPRRKRCQHQFQQHFSSQGHSASDLQVSVLQGGLRDTRQRKIIEQKLIAKFRTHEDGLNRDIGFMSRYRT